MGEIAWEHLSPIQVAQLLHFRPELRGEYEEGKRIETEKKLLESQERQS